MLLTWSIAEPSGLTGPEAALRTLAPLRCIGAYKTASRTPASSLASPLLPASSSFRTLSRILAAIMDLNDSLDQFVSQWDALKSSDNTRQELFEVRDADLQALEYLKLTVW